MRFKLVCAAMLGFAILQGCSSTEQVQYQYPTLPTITIEDPDPINTKNVEFEVISLDDDVYYALDTENYIALSYNILEIQRYIRQQNAIISNVKDYLNTEN